jgi:hypothetical protein
MIFNQAALPVRIEKALPVKAFCQRGQIRNPNIEIRNKFEILMFRSPKHCAELVVGDPRGHKSVLVIWYCFEFRALVFEFPSGKEDSSVGLLSRSSL